MKTSKKKYVKTLLGLIEKSLGLDPASAKHYLKAAKLDRASERVASAMWVEQMPESEDTAILRYQLKQLDREGCFDFEAS